MTPLRLFFKLILRFDLATSLFRSYELSVVQDITENLRPRGFVLDIGCAEGNVASEVFAKDIKLVGLDYLWSFLPLARSKKLYRNLIEADAAAMPFKGKEFEILFSNSVIEHIGDLDSVLKEARRILKSEGRFIFTVPNQNFTEGLFFTNVLNALKLKTLAQKYSQERNKRLNHRHLYSQAEWDKKLAEKGFRVVKMISYVSRPTLMMWDFIAAVQFAAKAVLEIFMKIPVMSQILALAGFIVRIAAAILMVPFVVLQKRIISNGCATLIEVRG